MLTDADPPVLSKVPIDLTSQAAGRIMARVLTVGEDEFRAAATLAAAGKTAEAIAAFERLRVEYPGSWIDRVSAQRLEELRRKTKPDPKSEATPEKKADSVARRESAKGVSPAPTSNLHKSKRPRFT